MHIRTFRDTPSCQPHNTILHEITTKLEKIR